jgi:hypothetical protein
MAHAMNTFFNSIKPHIPSDITIQVEDNGDIFDPITGTISGVWTTSVISGFYGTGSGLYASPVGVCVNEHTGSYMDGREVRGRMFLVPLVSDVFTVAGGIDNSFLISLNGYLDTLRTAVPDNWQVWHRPKGGTGGASFAVASTQVKTQAAVLTSRRP